MTLILTEAFAELFSPEHEQHINESVAGQDNSSVFLTGP